MDVNGWIIRALRRCSGYLKIGALQSRDWVVGFQVATSGMEGYLKIGIRFFS